MLNKAKEKVIKIVSFFALAILILACHSSLNQPEIENESGVILTFDDNSIDSWFRADSIFKNDGWKATFCIAKFHEINQAEKYKLLQLQSEGHEIAFHGTHHVRAAYYLNDHTPEEYINYEILPDLDSMKNFGFNISSFAYPGGVRNEISDSILWNYFSVLRGTTFLALPPQAQRCFSKINMNKNKLLVYAIGLDSHYEHMRLSYIDTLLNYAFDNSQVVLFYGHHIEEIDTSDYITAYATIEHICDFVKEKRMKFYTLKDLVK